MSLCHYLGCTALLSRCEDNMLLVAADERQCRNQSELQYTEALASLLFAYQFDLQRVKEACIPLTAAKYRRAHRALQTEIRQSWDGKLRKLDKDTLLELLSAVYANCELVLLTSRLTAAYQILCPTKSQHGYAVEREWS